MKPSAVLVAVAIASTINAVSAERCSYPTIAPQLHSLAPEIAACAVTSGYNMIHPPEMPTPEQQLSLCLTCQAFITKVTPMKWPDCTLSIAGKEQSFTAYFFDITEPCRLRNAEL